MNNNGFVVENITSTDVNFQRVETKFDVSKRRSLMENTSTKGALI